MKTIVLFGVIAAALAAPLPGDKVVAVHGVAPALTYGSHALPYTFPGAVHHGLPAVHHGLPAVHTAVSYTAPKTVALPPAEVKVPITRTHVQVPVHQKVHYGTQSYVAGATTTIHKPSLSAPAIAPPSTLLAEVKHNAPELTIQHQEVPVEKYTPNFVDTPYHAGTIVKYTEPEVREVKVPTPYAQPVAVPHPVAVPQPIAVPHPVRQEIHSVNVHNLAPAVYTHPATVVKADY